MTGQRLFRECDPSLKLCVQTISPICRPHALGARDAPCQGVHDALDPGLSRLSENDGRWGMIDHHVGRSSVT